MDVSPPAYLRWMLWGAVAFLALLVLAWGIWGLGAIFLLALAVGVHVLISLIKRNGRSLEQVAQTARSRMAQGG